MPILSSMEIFFTWTIIAAALIGIGSIALALFSIDYSLIDAFWMGLVVSVTVLEFWNLVLPITGLIASVLLGTGTLGLLLNRSSLQEKLHAAWRGQGWLLLLG